MRVAYVTSYDAADVHAWSGLGTYILRALEAAGLRVETIGGLSEGLPGALLSRAKRLYYPHVRSQRYLRDRNPHVLRAYARQVARRLADVPHDVVFSPGTLPVSYLDTRAPIVFWTDATFDGLVDFYPDFSGLAGESLRDGHRAEQAALDRCRLAIYSSDWAAETARAHYTVDPAKVCVVPFGANVAGERDAAAVDAAIAARPFEPCRLLFVGVDWERKGGDVALAVAEALNERRRPTELHVVGCAPPPDAPAWVVAHGFVSKSTAEGRQRLDDLFGRAHFLILPTRADCVPVVFAEANSYGVPVLTTDVGGIRTAVRDGHNGAVFPLSAPASAYADAVTAAMASPQAYADIARRSADEYRTRLNWATAGARVAELMRGLVPAS